MASCIGFLSHSDLRQGFGVFDSLFTEWANSPFTGDLLCAVGAVEVRSYHSIHCRHMKKNAFVKNTGEVCLWWDLWEMCFANRASLYTALSRSTWSFVTDGKVIWWFEKGEHLGVGVNLKKNTLGLFYLIYEQYVRLLFILPFPCWLNFVTKIQYLACCLHFHHTYGCLRFAWFIDFNWIKRTFLSYFFPR